MRPEEAWQAVAVHILDTAAAHMPGSQACRVLDTRAWVAASDAWAAALAAA